MRRRWRRAVLACSALLATAPLAYVRSGPDEAFSDRTEDTHLVFRLENSPTSRKYLPETMCGGVAVFDYDNDSRLDIFFTNGAHIADPMPRGKTPEKDSPRYWNRLFHQNSDGSFTDVTEHAGVGGAGYSMGVAVGDYDNDGYEDLFVTGLDRTILYHNNGDGTFTDVTAKSRTAVSGWSTGAAFFDYDNDGRLDLFVARYTQWSFENAKICGDQMRGIFFCNPAAYNGAAGVLFHNNGDGTFTDVSVPSGIAKQAGRGLGVAFADYDGDGRTDFYVANDSMQSFLYHNNGDGTFSETSIAAGVGFDDDGNAFAGMGVDFADYDNDGRPDLIITDLAGQRYMLFKNAGDGTFTSETESSGLSRATRTLTGWGVRWIDINNDGWKDLFSAQGHTDESLAEGEIVTYKQKPLLLKNDAGHLRLWPGSPGSVFEQHWAGRGLGVGDLDNDGGLDLVVSNIGQRAYILHNNIGPRNHWVGIKPRGTRSNRDGVACRVKIVSASGLTQYYVVTTAGSYLSASDRRVVAGLGADTSAKLVEAHWPSGIVQRLENVRSNQWIDLVEPSK